MVVLQKLHKTTTTNNCVQHLCLQLINCEDRSERNILNCVERRLIAEILLDICEDCVRMAALPHGAFAACKLRESYSDRDLTVARMKSCGDKSDTKNMSSNKKLMDYSPVKYNGKLMNSIWGLYNRYSPHNIKGNEYEADDQCNNVQQHHNAVASFAIAQKMTMAMDSGNEWRFVDK